MTDYQTTFILSYHISHVPLNELKGEEQLIFSVTDNWLLNKTHLCRKKQPKALENLSNISLIA